MDTLEKLAISNEDCKDSAKMSAAIVKRNEIISFGFNSMKTHPLMRKYGKNKESVYLHAEISAIKNALRTMSIQELNGSDLYICRVKKTAPYAKGYVWGLAKPCEGCARAIIDFGIKNVYYTTDTNKEFKVI